MKDRYGNQLKERNQILVFKNGKFVGVSVYCGSIAMSGYEIVRADSILPALEKLKKIEEYVGESLWATDLPIKHLKKILRGESESDPNSTENLGQNPDSTEPEPLNEEVEP